MIVRGGTRWPNAGRDDQKAGSGRLADFGGFLSRRDDSVKARAMRSFCTPHNPVQETLIDADFIEILPAKAGQDSDEKNLESFVLVARSNGEPQVRFADIARPLDGEKMDSQVSRSGYASAQRTPDVTVLVVEKYSAVPRREELIDESPQVVIPLQSEPDLEERHHVVELLDDRSGLRNRFDIQCNNEPLRSIDRWFNARCVRGSIWRHTVPLVKPASRQAALNARRLARRVDPSVSGYLVIAPVGTET